MRATLIMNPRSGKRRALAVAEEARRIAAKQGVTLTERVITKPGHGTEFARAAVSAGEDRVIAVGGDGTLNAIAAGLVGSHTPMGIVAMGSGNGYARSLGLPLYVGKALQRALGGVPAAMDVCYLNDHLFLGTAGIGFDARVSHAFDKSKGRGMSGYLKIVLKEILGAEPMRVVVKANNETAEEHVLMLVFCNTREFGNGAIISPGSAPDDGLAELRLVAKPSFFPLLKAFFDVYTGRADRSPYIRNIVAREAMVHQAGTLAHVDGEPVVIGQEVRFRLEPKKLWVVK